MCLTKLFSSHTNRCRYGWSRARYVYSLISGVGIFFLGAGVTVYHGVAGLINPAPLENLVMVRCNKKTLFTTFRENCWMVIGTKLSRHDYLLLIGWARVFCTLLAFHWKWILNESPETHPFRVHSKYSCFAKIWIQIGLYDINCLKWWRICQYIISNSSL